VQALGQLLGGRIGAKLAEGLPSLNPRRQQTDYALVLLAQQLRPPLCRAAPTRPPYSTPYIICYLFAPQTLLQWLPMISILPILSYNQCIFSEKIMHFTHFKKNIQLIVLYEFI
ncbi:uncharacterized protein METZ01_LOCUS323535, partial [marine metagenome]